MPDKIKVSYVVTVYNKSAYLPYTIQSIKSQNLGMPAELIFVDDASTDNSAEIIKKETAEMKNVIIITNSQNKGPSTRLNQGAKKASGQYLHLVDGDEILPINATKIMLNLLEENQADFLYGKKQKTTLESKALLGQSISEELKYTKSSNPLLQILNGKFVGISLMTSKSLYTKSGGCDERVFIQDESLPIRLAHKAKNFISLDNIVVFAPKKNHENLSRLKNQQHHDRFLVYKYALEDFANSISDIEKKKMYQRAVSSVWKNKKLQGNTLEKLVFFLKYLYITLLKPAPNAQELKNMLRHFDKCNDIRRM